MEKPVVRQDVPEYDQETQYVVELEPVEEDDHIFIGLEIKVMPKDDTEGGNGMMMHG